MTDKSRREYGSGSVSQRKDGSWTARFVIGTGENGKPKVKAFYGKTEREVKKKLKEFKEEYYKNDKVSVRKNTVEAFMSDWLYNKKKNELKPKSFDRLEQTLMYQVFPNIGYLQLGALQASDVQAMINNLRDQGKSYSTIKKAYDAVNDCFRTAVIQRSVTFNPALGVSIPQKKTFDTDQIKCHSDDSIARIYSAARKKYSNGKPIYRLGDAIILDLNTGLRLAELISLKWEDVDLANKKIYVNSTRVIVKNRSDDGNKYVVIEQRNAKSVSGIRSVPLNEDAVEALNNLKAITGRFEYVLSTKDGKAVGPRYIDRLCRNIQVEGGISEEYIYGLHALRHTFASKLFAAGTDVKIVSEILGHSDVTITYNTYIHIINGGKESAVNSIKY